MNKEKVTYGSLGMANEWKDCLLGDVVELKRGYDLPQKERLPGDVPLVSSSGITDSCAKAMVKGPGVVTGRYGTLGQVFYVEQDFWPLNTTLYVHDFKGNDPRFVSYFLRDIDYFVYSDKAAVPGLNRNHLHQARVRIPSDPTEQRAIAHILGTLDDKIELNRKQNETLEAMARALFKAWFVDFEPVRAKIEGRWQRGQSLPGLPAHLYDLFPDRLVESELGEVPEGWDVARAGQIYDVGVGKTPPRKESEWFSDCPEHLPWMSIKDLGRSGLFISEVSEYLTPAAVERFRVRRIPDATVVLSFKLTVGRVAITDGEMLSNEAIAHFLPKAGNHLSSGYLYCYLRQFNFESLGSTSSIATAVNSDGVRSIPLLVPDKSIVGAFESTSSQYLMRIRSNQHELRTLAQLRDTMLPPLISGRVRTRSFIRNTKQTA